MREIMPVCKNADVMAIECRDAKTKKPHDETGQRVTCSLEHKIALCRNEDQMNGVDCFDYEMRVLCNMPECEPTPGIKATPTPGIKATPTPGKVEPTPSGKPTPTPFKVRYCVNFDCKIKKIIYKLWTFAQKMFFIFLVLLRKCHTV